MKKIAFLCFAFTSALVFPGARSRAEPVVVDRVAAIVGGQAVTTSEVRRDAELLRGQGGASGGETAILRAALNERIEREILNARLAMIGVRVSEEEVESGIADIAQQQGFSKDDIGPIIERQGITLAEYRERIRDQIAKSKVIGIEIRPRLVVDDEKARKYYDAHPEEFARPAAVHLADIFFAVPADAPARAGVDAEDRARKAIERIRSGEPFDAVARELSEGPAAKEGGDLGTFRSGELQADLEKAVEKLGPGEISEPVQAAGGIHVLNVVERVDAGARPFDEVKEKIREKINAPEMAKKYDEWLAKQKEDLTVVELVKPEEMVEPPSSAEKPASAPELSESGGSASEPEPSEEEGSAPASASTSEPAAPADGETGGGSP